MSAIKRLYLHPFLSNVFAFSTESHFPLENLIFQRFNSHRLHISNFEYMIYTIHISKFALQMMQMQSFTKKSRTKLSFQLIYGAYT